MHKFDYRWTLADANFTKDKGKVFSCFACGGGSSMGYKLAGFDVIGCNEIDHRMMYTYCQNNNPRFPFLEPIQTFKERQDLPPELFNLDILDGSPPCSTFSMAGIREDAWGKLKHFREGQAEQVLDTLFFDFIDLVNKNKVIAESLTPEEAEDYNMLTGYGLGNLAIHFVMLCVILNFIAMAVNIFRGEGISSGNCAALTFYAAWKIADMMSIVSNNVAVSRYSELMYEVLSYMTAVLFFMNTARFFNGMEKKFTRFWMCLSGYVSSILAAVSVIPRYILLLIPTGYEERLSMNIPSISDIGIVFMTITMVAVFWSTYVYRVMPRLSVGKRRWSRAPLNKQYLEIENIDIKPTE